MCDWALSVFGRINFSSKYAELSGGAKGVVLIDLPTKEMATVRGVVTSRSNAGVLIDRARFVATDDEGEEADVDVEALCRALGIEQEEDDV